MSAGAEGALEGRLLVDGRLQAGRLRWRDGLLSEVELAPELAASDELPIVAPGLIDLHVHGFGGCDPLEDLVASALRGRRPAG